MAGAAKNRVADEQKARHARPSSTNGSSSGATSSSGHPSRSATGTARTSGTNRTNASASRVAPSIRGYDGNRDPDNGSPAPAARDPATSRTTVVDPKNFDLGMTGWATLRSQNISSTMPVRQALSKLGQAIKVGLNTYHVDAFPTIPVYQYDVMVGSGVEKRGVIMKVWNSKAVQQAMGDGSIFDGNKLAWSGRKIDREIRVVVDLDQEQGRQPRDGKSDTHRVMIRCSNTVGFQTLLAHLKGQASFDNACLETINFADHLLRQTPSQRYTSIKRSFFQKGEKRFDLTGGVEAFKGVFASLRVVHPGRLSVNVDVANGTFWVSQQLPKTALQVCGARDIPDLIHQLERGESGRAGKELKRMRKMHVQASHRGRGTVDDYVIERFIYKSAKDHKVQVVDGSGKDVEKSLYDFFAQKYQIRLQYPGLPLCKMTRGKNIVLPMEVLTVKENQRYAFKMDERQTSNMIKFAVTAPPERYAGIEHGLKMLDWHNDPVLKKYGMKISTKKTGVDARLLTAPTVKFGTGEAKPGTSGRWDLKGKKFLQSNPTPLKSWSVTVISGRRGGKPDKSTIERFISAFVSGYKNHGGRVENANPQMNLATGDDVGAWVTNAWNAAGNQSQSRPQMLMFILPDKDSQVYGRIKRSCECRYGVVSQCVQYAHVQKAQPQYISNVCMKFNAKLGGITCRASGQKTSGPSGIFQAPTMIIGADVSHAAPGAQTPSMAAMTVSLDKLATRYAALCQTNGYRVEMINTDFIMTELRPMLQHWCSTVNSGKLPSTIIYMRDGVSEGQYSQVLEQEVADMKKLCNGIQANANVKFIVIVGSKRHHIRFFPDRGDRNGNAFPGTLVETGVTNPHENDFYLQSHAAIKGTARPVHYYVLLNEPNMTNDQLHTMLYEHSYQYQRATTPISQHPAIYYAHLASNRAIPHDPTWAGSSEGVPSSQSRPRSGSQSGSQGKSAGRSGSSSGMPSEFPKLMPMPNQGGIMTSMWYI